MIESIPDLLQLKPGVIALIIVIGTTHALKMLLGKLMKKGWVQALIPLLSVCLGLGLGFAPGFLSDVPWFARVYGTGVGALAVVLFSSGKRPMRLLLEHLPQLAKLLGTGR